MRNLNLMLSLMAIMLSACSTVNRGSNDQFRIDTVPQGAKVTTTVIDTSQKKKRRNQYGRYVNKNAKVIYHSCNPTPCAIELPRRSEFIAKIEHPDYEPTEVFIRSSTMKGGSTPSAAANLASSSGSGFALAGLGATYKAGITSFFSLGTQSVNTSGIASSGAAAGLGIGVGMIAIDVATGANLNLFPNPVVIELAPKDSAVRKDPLVELYKIMTEAKSVSETICATRKKDRITGAPTCQEARTEYRQKKEAYKMLKRQQLDELKASIKTAKAQQKATTTP